MPNVPYFTAENAAEMQRRSTARKLAEKSLAANPADRELIAQKFQEQRLVRVRKQLEAIDGLIENEMAKNCDPGKLDRLASAAIRLNEQERQLSNRSLPPTLKASQVKAKRSSGNSPEPESA